MAYDETPWWNDVPGYNPTYDAGPSVASELMDFSPTPSWLDDSPQQYDGRGFPLTTGGELAFDDAAQGGAERLAPQGGEPFYKTLWAGAQNAGSMLDSPGGKLLQGMGGGLMAYLDAQKKNRLMKQMMEQAAQEKAAKAAMIAKYQDPISLNGTSPAKTAQAWSGTGNRHAFANNALSPSWSKFAEGGEVGCYADGGSIDPRGFFDVRGGGSMISPDFLKYLANRILPSVKERPAPRASAVEERNAELQDVKHRMGTEYSASGGYMAGGTSGQSDKIPAMLSDGEFVMDADTVSALGDGNNKAGASALEQMRQNVRKHKRSAPVNKIPPKAKAPQAYLKGAK